MYQITHFTPPQGFVYAISDKSEGNQSFVYGEFSEVKNNRQKFLNLAGIAPEHTVAMLVNHGDVIREVGVAERGKSVYNQDEVVVCDAMITNQKNVALYLLVADCAPIVLFDKAQTCLAIVHHGIKNTDNSFVQKVINKMIEKYHIKPEELIALIGPAIQKESYIYETFEHRNSAHWQGFFELNNNNKFLIDNVGLTLKQIKDSGVLTENIFNSGIDTYTNKNFFSHKFDYDNGTKPDTGRLAMVAMLR